MPTYRLVVEYQGTKYSGWQEQRNARTVAGELRAALGRAGGRVLDLGGAGRTDAGVHALGQVAHARLERRIDPEPFRRAVNDILPADIHLLAVAPAPDDFHARHDAVLRSYVYQLARRRTTFARRAVWWIKRPLDPAPMAEAAALLVGRHDYASFCERPAEQDGTIVVVESAEIAEQGGLILFRIAASHFLWKMVRRIVGALVHAGAGEWSPADIEVLLDGEVTPEARNAVAESTAPPSGLFLERILYRGDPPLGPLAAPLAVAAEPVLRPLAPKEPRERPRAARPRRP